jgi:Uncharacterized protein conserved in bacteria (DUF2252)
VSERFSCCSRPILGSVAVRNPSARDPFQEIVGTWLIRRLSPDSNPIDIDDLPKKRDEETLIHAKGCEAANVHLGSRNTIKSVLKDSRARKPNWLRRAAKDVAKAVERQWKEFTQR